MLYSMLKCWLITFILILFIIPQIFCDVYENEVKCFCDKIACPGSLVCTGKWCLIGIQSDGGPGKLHQMCGWEDDERPPVNCAEGWNKWTEVCACTEHLCNTFAFLRANMDRQHEDLLGDEHRGRNNKLEGNMRSSQNTKRWYQQNNQIVLLILIPLGVGGFLVCLIFLNFHCKLG